MVIFFPPIGNHVLHLRASYQTEHLRHEDQFFIDKFERVLVWIFLAHTYMDK